MVIKIALDLGIKKKIIQRTIPKIQIIGRVQHIKKGKLKNMLNKQEELILDGCHSEVSSKNLAKYLRQLKVSNKIGIFGILKSRKKEASKILKNFKGIFKTLLVLKIPETNSVSSYDLKKIATKHNFNVLESENLRDALKKISTNKKKIITIFGSLYLIANALSLN
jgi:folylpolyglutamate synthase/dihydropteroate synthase